MPPPLRRFPTPPRPLRAGPALRPTTNVPQQPATGVGPLAAATGGIWRGPALTIPANTTLFLTSDLTLISNGPLQIAGKIRLAPGVPVPINVTLISLTADVTITGQVGGGHSDNGFDVVLNGWWPVAGAGPGTNGGYIRVLAPQGSITIEDTMEGFSGGHGGRARARGFAAPGRGWGGTAIAVGGEGGAGGHVLLHALESINVFDSVTSGYGGGGGSGEARASNGEDAIAIGGPGNESGVVRFEGADPQNPVDVTISLSVDAGDAGVGGAASAHVLPPPNGAGGSAEATGGIGGHGATIEFVNCVVDGQGQIVASRGGGGGNADARGGDGESPRWPRRAPGAPGGPAYATGGDGEWSGTIPTFRRRNGGMGQGTVQQMAIDAGGNATAVGGTGGNGSRGRGGGRSGISVAQGGAGGQTQSQPLPGLAPPIAPPPGRQGAAAGLATSQGSP